MHQNPINGFFAFYGMIVLLAIAGVLAIVGGSLYLLFSLL